MGKGAVQTVKRKSEMMERRTMAISDCRGKFPGDACSAKTVLKRKERVKRDGGRTDKHTTYYVITYRTACLGSTGQVNHISKQRRSNT